MTRRKPEHLVAVLRAIFDNKGNLSATARNSLPISVGTFLIKTRSGLRDAYYDARARVMAGEFTLPPDLKDLKKIWLDKPIHVVTKEKPSIEGLLRKKGPISIQEISDITDIPVSLVKEELDHLSEHGINISESGDHYFIDKTQVPAYMVASEIPTYISRSDNTFKFGFTTDNHLGSKYERLDVLEDLYDRFSGTDPFAPEGVDRVFNGGNWVEGMGRSNFNLHEVLVHGIDAQMRYLAEHYPQRADLVTYAVSGNDHEGWWAQREGIDVGKYAENMMRNYGREDWVDMGYMESHVRLVNANTGKESVLALVHPGGGTGYALSYTTQKIIEALEGGEKPAVWLGGHYHKLWAGNIRNVWCILGGCTQDQTSFMRSKVRQEAHVGGVIAELEQDPESGAIIACMPKMIRYFNREFYSKNRWSFSGPTDNPKRVVK